MTATSVFGGMTPLDGRQTTTFIVMTEAQVEELCDRSAARAVAKYREEHPDPAEDRLRPSSEWCKRLDIDRVTLWRWTKEGKLKPTKIGGKLYFRESDFNNIIK